MNISVVRCFIIQPFGITINDTTGESLNNDTVYNSLKKLEEIDPQFPVEIFRGDNEPITKENLPSHVSECIDNSDFCIADLTEKNPNVCYEVGYAVAKGLRVIIICQERSELPSDLKGLMFVTYKDTNLSTLANRIHKKYFDNLKDSIYKKNTEEKLPKIPYLSKRNDKLIRRKILASKYRIDILQTNLSVLQRDFIDDLAAVMESKEDLEIRILTLDPQSVFVNYRANQLEDTEVKLFRAELQNALELIGSRLRKFEKRVTIKIYDDFPSQIAFFFDQEVLACVVSAMGRSRDNCAFLVPPNLPNAQKSFADHFSHLWNNKSRTYREFSMD